LKRALCFSSSRSKRPEASRTLRSQLRHATAFAGAPQSFQIVELARLCREDVDNEIDVVQKNPFTFLVPFDVQRPNALLSQPFIDAFGNGLIVPAGSPCADQKVIGERADVVEINDDNVLCLFIERGFDCFSELVVFCFLVNRISPHE
jgi:hypothetical protein